MSQDLKISDQVNEIDYDNGWTELAQDAFEEFKENCRIKQAEHADAQAYFSKWYRWCTYPILLLAGANSVLASLNVGMGGIGSNGEDPQVNYSLPVAILTGVHATALAFMSFVEYGTRSSNHNLSSSSYASLARYIDSQILLKPADRDSPKFNFEIVSREFDAIASNEPSIPGHIQQKHLKNQNKNVDKDENNLLDMV